jgi:HEPN domain-containing protein
MSVPSPGHDAWVAKAEDDFLTIETIVQASRVPWDIICFHAQQGAEKYLKAFLRFHSQEPPWTHDLPALLRLCRNIEPALAELKHDCGLLLPYAATSRYPGVVPEADRAIAEQLVAAARRIREAIRQRLPGAQP